jgi:hypothetical protein
MSQSMLISNDNISDNYNKIPILKSYISAYAESKNNNSSSESNDIISINDEKLMPVKINNWIKITIPQNHKFYTGDESFIIANGEYDIVYLYTLNKAIKNMLTKHGSLRSYLIKRSISLAVYNTGLISELLENIKKLVCRFPNNKIYQSLQLNYQECFVESNSEIQVNLKRKIYDLHTLFYLKVFHNIDGIIFINNNDYEIIVNKDILTRDLSDPVDWLNWDFSNTDICNYIDEIKQNGIHINNNLSVLNKNHNLIKWFYRDFNLIRRYKPRYNIRIMMINTNNMKSVDTRINESSNINNLIKFIKNNIVDVICLPDIKYYLMPELVEKMRENGYKKFTRMYVKSGNVVFSRVHLDSISETQINNGSIMKLTINNMKIIVTYITSNYDDIIEYINDSNPDLLCIGNSKDTLSKDIKMYNIPLIKGGTTPIGLQNDFIGVLNDSRYEYIIEKIMYKWSINDAMLITIRNFFDN